MSSKNNLQELLQKRSCQLPKYEQLERSGPAHKPSFTCKVTVKWTDGNTYQEEGSGTKKAEAEKEAAKKMLDKLVLVEKSKPSQQYFSSVSPRVSPLSTTPKRDFDIQKQFLSPTRMKSQLQEILQRNGMPVPQYTDVKRTGPSHQPTFTVKLKILSNDRQTVVWENTGTGSSKALAESDVAKKGLNFVNEVIEKDNDLFLLKNCKPKPPPSKKVDPEVNAILLGQLPCKPETVFLQPEGSEGEKTWLCMMMIKHSKLKTTVASHGQGETREDAEREAKFNLVHSIEALKQ